MDVLVVYDAKKLPPEIQQLQDVDRPLPAGTQFFEQRFTFADLAKQFIWGAILIPAGALLAVVATITFFHLDRYASNYDTMSKILGGADIVALLLIACGCLFLKSMWPTYQFIRRQNRGLATRQGIFLIGDLLISNEDGTTKVVPKAFVRGLKDRQLEFEHDGQTKSLSLPGKLVGEDVRSLDVAVANWAG